MNKDQSTCMYLATGELVCNETFVNAGPWVPLPTDKPCKACGETCAVNKKEIAKVNQGRPEIRSWNYSPSPQLFQ